MGLANPTTLRFGDNSTCKFQYTSFLKLGSHYSLLLVLVVDEVSADVVELSVAFVSVFISAVSALAATGGFFPA